MHNAHVIQMKQHIETRPLNLIKLVMLGLCVRLTHNTKDCNKILRKLTDHMQHEWLT